MSDLRLSITLYTKNFGLFNIGHLISDINFSNTEIASKKFEQFGNENFRTLIFGI